MDNASLQTLVGEIMLTIQTLIVVFLAYGAYLSIVVGRDWRELADQRGAGRQALPVQERGANTAAKARSELMNPGYPESQLPGRMDVTAL